MNTKVESLRILFTVIIILLFSVNSFAGGYPGFKKLLDKECAILSEECLQNLPSTWHKYKGFVKICELKRHKAEKSKISIISIWAHDYLDSKNLDIWDDFPFPIIIDDEWNHLGCFPELYPVDDINRLYVYYGRWKSGIPTEIRIDVAESSVFGDYYYSPLIWNTKTKKYLMKDTEDKSGKRPK